MLNSVLQKYFDILYSTLYFASVLTSYVKQFILTAFWRSILDTIFR